MIVPLPYYDPIIVLLSYNLQDDDSTKVHVYYLLSDLILAFMFIRIYFIIRVIFNYSKYSDEFSQKIAHHHGISANMRYAFKARLTRFPSQTITLLFIWSTFVLAYVLRIFEMPYYAAIHDREFQSLFNSIWCIVISITTIGYGDVVPYTFLGRMLIMIASIWGTFLISLIIATVADAFTLKRNELKAFHHLLQTRKAAETITAAMRYWMAKKQYVRT